MEPSRASVGLERRGLLALVLVVTLLLGTVLPLGVARLLGVARFLRVAAAVHVRPFEPRSGRAGKRIDR